MPFVRIRFSLRITKTRSSNELTNYNVVTRSFSFRFAFVEFEIFVFVIRLVFTNFVFEVGVSLERNKRVLIVKKKSI